MNFFNIRRVFLKFFRPLRGRQNIRQKNHFFDWGPFFSRLFSGSENFYQKSAPPLRRFLRTSLGTLTSYTQIVFTKNKSYPQIFFGKQKLSAIFCGWPKAIRKFFKFWGSVCPRVIVITSKIFAPASSRRKLIREIIKKYYFFQKISKF